MSEKAPVCRPPRSVTPKSQVKNSEKSSHCFPCLEGNAFSANPEDSGFHQPLGSGISQDFSQIPVHTSAAGVIQKKVASSIQLQTAERVRDEDSEDEDSEDEEEELLQGKFTSTVSQTQIKESGGASNTFTGLPIRLRARLEILSGLDLSGVRVYPNSSKPAQINALAYTQGKHIYLGPGQEKYLSHEGWHVVQQSQGRVKQTMQAKGVSINDDKGLEAEADFMGTKALRAELPPKTKLGSALQGIPPAQREVGTTHKKEIISESSRAPQWKTTKNFLSTGFAIEGRSFLKHEIAPKSHHGSLWSMPWSVDAPLSSKANALDSRIVQTAPDSTTRSTQIITAFELVLNRNKKAKLRIFINDQYAFSLEAMIKAKVAPGKYDAYWQNGRLVIKNPDPSADPFDAPALARVGGKNYKRYVRLGKKISGPIPFIVEGKGSGTTSSTGVGKKSGGGKTKKSKKKAGAGLGKSKTGQTAGGGKSKGKGDKSSGAGDKKLPPEVRDFYKGSSKPGDERIPTEKLLAMYESYTKFVKGNPEWGDEGKDFKAWAEFLEKNTERIRGQIESTEGGKIELEVLERLTQKLEKGQSLEFQGKEEKELTEKARKAREEEGLPDLESNPEWALLPSKDRKLLLDMAAKHPDLFEDVIPGTDVKAVTFRMKRALALGIAVKHLPGEISGSLIAMVKDPAFWAFMAGTIALYVGLWLAPEPFSKIAATALTVFLLAYVTIDSILMFARAWLRLNDTCKYDAETGNELIAAGKQFAADLGPVGAQIVLLIAFWLGAKGVRAARGKIKGKGKGKTGSKASSPEKPAGEAELPPKTDAPPKVEGTPKTPKKPTPESEVPSKPRNDPQARPKQGTEPKAKSDQNVPEKPKVEAEAPSAESLPESKSTAKPEPKPASRIPKRFQRMRFDKLRDLAKTDPKAARALINRYWSVDLKKLRALAKKDPEAARILLERYRRRPLKRLKEDYHSDPNAKQVLDEYYGKETAELLKLESKGDVLARRVLDDAYGRRSRDTGKRPTLETESTDPHRGSKLGKELDRIRKESPEARGEPEPGKKGKVQGGTVGVGKTDIVGLENKTFGGASKKAGGKPVEGEIKSPSKHKRFQGHAEEGILNRIDRAIQRLIKRGKMKLEDLKGKTVWMKIEQEVCSVCRQGLKSGSEAQPGVIKQFSLKYPELTIEVSSPATSEVILVRNGKVVGTR